MKANSQETGHEQKYVEEAKRVIKHWLDKGFRHGRYVNDEILFLKIASDGRCFPLDTDYALNEIAKCVKKGQDFYMDEK